MNTTTHRIGTFDTYGFVRAGDPELELDGGSELIQIRPGKYIVSVESEDFDTPHSLMITNYEDKHRSSNEWKRVDKEIQCESGLIGVFDEHFYRNEDITRTPDWESYVSKFTINENMAGVLPGGGVSCCGSETCELFYRLDNSGNITALKLQWTNRL